MRRPGCDICLVSLGWSVAGLVASPEGAMAGGAELQVARLGRLLAASGKEVVFTVLDLSRQGWPAPSALPPRVRLVAMYRPRSGIPYLRYVYATVPQFWSGLRRADAAVYYLRGASGFVGLAAAFCRRHGRRLVLGISSDADLDRGLLAGRMCRRDRMLYGWGLQRADAVVVQTRDQERLLREHWGREGVLIRSLAAEWPAGAAGGEGECVLWAGRARRTKRPELFLELARRVPQVSFAMATQAMWGEEALYEQVERQAREIPNLAFLGPLPYSQMEAQFGRCWLLVNTSEYEGFPNTFLEAWGRGLPVVATVDPDGLLSERGLGWPCRTLEEMAARVRWLAGQPAVRAEVGARAREYVAVEHSAEAVVARYVSLLESLSAGAKLEPAATRPGGAR